MTAVVLMSMGVWVFALNVARTGGTPAIGVEAGPEKGPSSLRQAVGTNQPRRKRAHKKASGRKPASSWYVTGVVDGDTIVVTSAEGTEEHLRVIGIDTPERGSCGYAEASDALAAMVLNRRVELSPGAVDDRDHYGRLLRYVDVGGEDAGLAMIEEGLAVARYDSRDGYGHHPREEGYVAADASTPSVCEATAEQPAAQADPPPAATGNGAWPGCNEARAAGAAPVYRGDAGYGEHLDGDGDGVGCE